MPDFDEDSFEDGETGVATESRRKVEKPPLYKVLLHNDDYTSMDFVVFILMSVFYKDETDARRIMLEVHNRGVGVAGVFTYEVAESKINKVTALARANEFPLLCSMEKD
ncbi:MAG: ATP-dependent Clp protease adaptor ClpS [Candidatus Obscuribacterales bacterium]|nr:ATP-dependent Clp protease adaptor ClpS [Candidatus Obscuribacterales bacterium]